jgi:HEAT repeat protein
MIVETMKKLYIAILACIICTTTIIPFDHPISLAADTNSDVNASKAIPPWRLAGFSAALRDPSPAVLRQVLLDSDAAIIFQQLDELPQDQIDRMIAMLMHPDPQVCMAAVEALVALDDLPAEQITRLVEILMTADTNTRSHAVQVLSQRKDTAGTQAHGLAMRLKDAPAAVCRDVSKVLIAWAENLSSERHHLGGLLEDPNPAVRLAAAQILTAMGPAAAEEAKRLVLLIDDADPDIQEAGVAAISAIGKAAVFAAPDVVGFLDHSKPEVRSRAIRMLASLGGSDEQCLKTIMAQLGDPDVQVRITAADALAEMGNSASQSKALLHDCLIDTDPNLRAAAFKALVAIDGVALIPPPVFRNALNDADPQVRLAAAGALKEQTPPACARFLIGLLGDENIDVRIAAGDALGNMKADGLSSDMLDQLAELLKDPNRLIRREAIRVFGILGPLAREYAAHAASCVHDQDSQVAYQAGRTLAAMGDQAVTGQIPRLIELLKSPDIQTVSAAASTLSQLGTVRLRQLDDLLKLLKDPRPDVVSYAGMALTGIAAYAVDEIPRLAGLLRDQNEEVRWAAAQAFTPPYPASPDASNAWALTAAEYIRDLLKTGDNKVKYTAVNIFMRLASVLGESGRTFVPDLAAALEIDDLNVQFAVLNTIGQIAETAGGLADLGAALSVKIDDLLDDANRDLRYRAVFILSKIGPVAQIHLPHLVNLMNDPYYEIHTLAMTAMKRLNRCELNQILLFVNAAAMNESVTGEARYLAHLLSGGDARVETLLAWLGRPAIDPINRLGGDRAEAVHLLNVFLEAWNHSQSQPALRQELARAIARVAQAVQWQMADVALLEKHARNLEGIGSFHASAVRQAIPSDRFVRALHLLRNVWLVHGLFWLMLIFAYPKSPQIQAIFFWNPWIRRITGFGYVGMALAWIPLLRKRLFAPFRESLLADAALEAFDTHAYFKESGVRVGNDLRLRPVVEAIPEIKGQIILEGESGLGKTMFLRYLVKHSRRIVVFLSAYRCEKGVLEAMRAKLHGPAKDPKFLRNLLHAGALDICIDGLNEVSADTRAKITTFLESFFKGNIILGTQPLEWTPPATAKTCFLQPLTRRQIVSFLNDQARIQLADGPLDEKTYQVRCSGYVTRAFESRQPQELFEATMRVLSNPMDLTMVARMIAHGEEPSLFHLESQQYEIMAQNYQRLHVGRTFPLEKFSEYVYQMRLQQTSVLSQEPFKSELECMERHKIVLARYQASDGKTSQKVWYFRHDKIMDFFIVQAFLGEENRRPQEHLGDPRFRGVYFLLAMLLSITDAMALRERLIDYAADTRDHTVSDTFIQLLRSRKAA